MSRPEAIMALSRNGHLVRQLDLGRRDIVYYCNCAIAFLDQLDTQQHNTTTMIAIDTRPAWLAPPDPHLCTVIPIPPMTMLVNLDLDFAEWGGCETCPYYLPSYRDPKATITQACWIIDSNPNILDLKLRSVLIKDYRDALLLTTTLFQLQRLRTFYIGFCLWNHTTLHLMPKVGLDFLFACPPSLRKLTIMSYEDSDYSESEVFTKEYTESEPGTLLPWEKPTKDCRLTMTIPRRQEPLLDLRELQLGHLDEDLTKDDFQSILLHCPNLTALQVPRLRGIGDLLHFARGIARWCPKLSDLANNGFDANGDEVRELLVWILKALPEQQVTRFHWSGVPSATIQGLGDVGSIFRRHSATLRVISLNGYKNIDSKAVQAILVGCEALEKCEIQWPMYGDQRQLCLHLEDAVEIPWACTRIQNLRLTIAIPDRPLHFPSNYTTHYYDRRPLTALSAEETQQFRELELFYQQLGKLTELQRLELQALYFDPTGERDVSWAFGANSFPGMLSLGSEEAGRPGYLHLLRGLSKLKALVGSVSADAKETQVTVGMDEVEWMDKHWPVLEEAGFFTASRIATKPFCWLLEQRQLRGQKLDLCAYY